MQFVASIKFSVSPTSSCVVDHSADRLSLRAQMCRSRLLLLFLTSLLLAFLGLVLCKLLPEGVEDLLRLCALDALWHLDVAHVAALLKNLGQLLEAYT